MKSYKKGDHVNLLNEVGIIAEGEIIHASSTDLLQNRPFPSGHIGVTVKVCHDATVELPVSNEIAEMFVLGDAIGSVIAWPIVMLAPQANQVAAPSTTGQPGCQVFKNYQREKLGKSEFLHCGGGRGRWLRE
ncbi:hypothetical protein O6H91_08G067700 [Diphasiastrum complanatum]|uniref:Uncharacterized protein n=1 Tax=Diphasiastrum complanatum TaxID=34168 RepID=A0ACC2CYH0_DIPCM|nr:hypothetical protein O6H91_08G067700 [Diphasiastrum complanatum]